MDYWKIPSGEITNLPYLLKIGRLGGRVIMSTGMATLNEDEPCQLVGFERSLVVRPRQTSRKSEVFLDYQWQQKRQRVCRCRFCCIIAGESEIAAVFVALAEEEFVVDVFLTRRSTPLHAT